MGRTILRSANTSEVTDVSESFANFTTFNGINEDKSFIGTDQNSFEESNNMYVDINGQLSTRPPIETRTIDVLDGYAVRDIIKVNGITFYKCYKLNYVAGEQVDCTSNVTQIVHGQVTENNVATDYVNVTYKLSTTYNYDVHIVISWFITWYNEDFDTTVTLLTGTTTTTIHPGQKTVNIDVDLYDLAELQYAHDDGNLSYSITFTAYYYTVDEYQNYHIIWKYNDEWLTVTSVKEYDVKYIQGYYIFYNEDTLIAYKYNGSSWTEYSLADIIYIPVTEVREGSSVTEGVSNNILTTAYIITYLLDNASNIITDTSDLIGKDVTIEIDGEDYELTWQVGYDVILSKKVSVISHDVNYIISNNPSTDYVCFVAYYGYWYLNSTTTDTHGCYYSVDGILWTPITFPVSNGNFSAQLAESAMQLWVQLYELDDGNATLYCYDLPTVIISTSEYLSYKTYTYKLFNPIGFNTFEFVEGNDTGIISTAVDTVNDVSVTYDSFTPTVAQPLIHFVNTDTGVVLFKGVLTRTTYTRLVTTDKIAKFNPTMHPSNTYTYITSSEDGILYAYTDTSIEMVYTPETDIFSAYVLVIINNGIINTYCTEIADVDESAYPINTLRGWIRWYPNDSNTQIISLYYNNFGSNITRVFPAFLDSNYVPYYNFKNNTFNIFNLFIENYEYNWLPVLANNNSSVNVGHYIYYTEHEKFIDGVQHYYLTNGYTYQNVNFTLQTNSNYNTSYISNTNSSITYYSSTDTTTTVNLDYTVYQYNAAVTETTDAEQVRLGTGDVEYPFYTNDFTVNNTSITDSTNHYLRMYVDTSTNTIIIVGSAGVYYNSTFYTYIQYETTCLYYGVGITTALASDNTTTVYYFYYYTLNLDTEEITLYTTNYDSALIKYLVTADGGTEITNKDYNYLSMDFTAELLTTTIASGNYLYQASGTEDDKLYIPEDSKVELPDNVTGLIEFSQTVLGVFLPYTAYEYTVSSSDDGSAYYYLYPTKLVIGNRSGYDLLQSYDGSSIYISTVKGVATLTYEELVQSTEHVFTYLTDNILGAYKEFDTSAIKFCQYLNWLFMYRQDSNICYLYDISNSAWWKWTLPDNITKIYWDTENDVLIVLMSNTLYYFNFDTDDFYDYGTEVINWNFKSQKLHLSAPNNYKHIRRISIVTTQNTDKMRYKLKFTNYKSWERLQDKYVVEYDIDNLNTLIQKVNFMKCNAFQFEISNDTTWKYPQKFVVSNIAIKYRVTEDIR